LHWGSGKEENPSSRNTFNEMYVGAGVEEKKNSEVEDGKWKLNLSYQGACSWIPTVGKEQT